MNKVGHMGHLGHRTICARHDRRKGPQSTRVHYGPHTAHFTLASSCGGRQVNVAKYKYVLISHCGFKSGFINLQYIKTY